MFSLPIFHVSGISILFRVFFGKGTLVLGGLDSYSLSLTTFVSMVFTQYSTLVSILDKKLCAQLKCVLMGGSAIPDAVVQDCMDKELSLFLTYGLTEFSSQVALSRDFNNYTLLPHVDSNVSCNQTLLIKGDSLFQGYIESSNINIKLDSEGYFDTGDCITKDSERYQFNGRRDNLIISGGEIFMLKK